MAAFTIYSGADDALSFNVTDADDATILQAALDAYSFTLNVTHVGSSIIVLTATGTATADSTVVISLTDTQTATLTPGEYAYQLTSELGIDFDVIDEGTITVKAIATTGTPTDTLASLATSDDLSRFGYDSAAATMLARATARVRGYTRQEITAGTSTIIIDYPFCLPQRPVTAVTAVYDMDANEIAATEYTLRGSYIMPDTLISPLTITYSHGYATLPDELIELVCSVASRMYSASTSLTQGVRSEQAGGEMITYGSDAYAGTTELTQAEKNVLDRLFPRRASVAILQ